MAHVHIEDNYAALLAGADAEIGLGPAVPPLPNLVRLAAGVVEAVPGAGVLAHTAAALLPAGAARWALGVQRQDRPSQGGSAEGRLEQGIHAFLLSRGEEPSALKAGD